MPSTQSDRTSLSKGTHTSNMGAGWFGSAWIRIKLFEQHLMIRSPWMVIYLAAWITTTQYWTTLRIYCWSIRICCSGFEWKRHVRDTMEKTRRWEGSIKTSSDVQEHLHMVKGGDGKRSRLSKAYLARMEFILMCTASTLYTNDWCVQYITHWPGIWIPRHSCACYQKKCCSFRHAQTWASTIDPIGREVIGEVFSVVRSASSPSKPTFSGD